MNGSLKLVPLLVTGSLDVASNANIPIQFLIDFLYIMLVLY